MTTVTIIITTGLDVVIAVIVTTIIIMITMIIMFITMLVAVIAIFLLLITIIIIIIIFTIVAIITIGARRPTLQPEGLGASIRRAKKDKARYVGLQDIGFRARSFYWYCT